MKSGIFFDTSEIMAIQFSAARIGGASQRNVTYAVRNAMRPVLAAAKKKAPYNKEKKVDDVHLRHSLLLKGERNRRRGKKVYQVVVDPKKTDGIFAKISKVTGKRAYYPSSQEYGWRAPTKTGFKQIPGKHYLKDALTENEVQVARDIVDGVLENVEKEWKKKHG